MNPDLDGLKHYIGGLVLDVFVARGEIKALQQKLADATNPPSGLPGSPAPGANTPHASE